MKLLMSKRLFILICLTWDQNFSIIFVHVGRFVEYVCIYRVSASAQVIHNPVCKVDHVVDTDHVVASALVQPPRLGPSVITCLLDTPLQTAGVLIRKLQQLLGAPEGGHFLVVARHLAPVGQKNIVIGVVRGVNVQKKLRILVFFLYIQLNDAACTQCTYFISLCFLSELFNITPFIQSVIFLRGGYRDPLFSVLARLTLVSA